MGRELASLGSLRSNDEAGVGSLGLWRKLFDPCESTDRDGEGLGPHRPPQNGNFGLSAKGPRSSSPDSDTRSSRASSIKNLQIMPHCRSHAAAAPAPLQVRTYVGSKD